MAKKDKKSDVTLECSDCKNRNYITGKSLAVRTKRLELKKFCSVCRKHTTHKETR